MATVQRLGAPTYEMRVTGVGGGSGDGADDASGTAICRLADVCRGCGAVSSAREGISVFWDPVVPDGAGAGVTLDAQLE